MRPKGWWLKALVEYMNSLATWPKLDRTRYVIFSIKSSFQYDEPARCRRPAPYFHSSTVSGTLMTK